MRWTKGTRRSFLAYILGTSLGGFLLSVFYPIIKYLNPPRETEVIPNSVLAGNLDLLKPNSGMIVRFGKKPLILIRTKTGEYRAFSAVCTHLACIVQYRSDFKHIWCACHNGHYNQKGINIAGPPPRPLEPYKIDIKDNNVFISKITK